MKTNSGDFVAILVYADDILIGSNSAQIASNVKGFFSSQFKLKDLGKVKFFLGLEIAQSPEGISICQRKYILDLLEEHGLLGSKPVSTPIDYNYKLSKTKDGQELHDATKYKQLVGKLLYLTFTRPDISYAVQVLSQFMDKPSNEHFMAAYRVIRYLKRALSQGILMKSKSNMKISAYSDSDWAGCPDLRKSITGFSLFIGDSLVSWKSNKQTVVARSSVEAEYRSMASTCCEIIWLQYLLANFRISHKEAISLFFDSQSAIYISKNPVFHERTTHIGMDCHFLREKVLAGIIKPIHISTQSQIANIFTKAL
ncbi:PREDICTED: uncharacterized mitochondrial protein AtMg00810-like [Theobroma cacao]|uniref:Uncharacterized mitochondrial protein AtMg00810-like n=1 Tax=Theobroma cacao TaxID=3641 RepID=A0AB32W3T4_THECC|nr:PREDICTED: uncharacterized mitochondrial protein AtMg00810-like [Theobroma cacao]